MKNFELRLSPGATDVLGREKALPKRACRQNFSCPWSCDRSRSCTQPHSLRISVFAKPPSDLPA